MTPPKLPPPTEAVTVRAGRPDVVVADETVRPMQMLGTLRRRWFWIVGGAVLGAAIGLLIALRIPPAYRGSATLWVDELERNAPRVATVPNDISKANINTEIELLQSRRLTEEVIDSLGLALTVVDPARIPRSNILREVFVAPGAEPRQLVLTRDSTEPYVVYDTASAEPIGKVAAGERFQTPDLAFRLAKDPPRTIRLDVASRPSVVRAFEERRDITRPNRLANTIAIQVDDADPMLARDQVNLLVRRFLVRRNEVMKRGPRETVSFLRAQVASVTSDLDRAEQTLKGYRQRERIAEPQAQASGEVTRYVTTQAKREEINSDRLALQRALTDARAAAADPATTSPYRRLMAFPTLMQNEAVVSVLNDINSLEQQRQDLLTRRTPADPDVKALDDKIGGLESRVETITASYVDGLGKQVTQLDTVLTRYAGRLDAVPGKEGELIRLERSAHSLADMQVALLTRLKEAEIASGLSDGGVQQVDQAELPDQPVRPKPKLLLLLGLLVGLGTGTLAAFGRQTLDRTVHTRAEVAHLLGAPVLGVIPRIPRFRRHRAAVAATEAFRHLHANLLVGGEHTSSTAQVLVITSPMPGEGKTTSVANLAMLLAQRGERVCVIDADLRGGVLHQVFGMEQGPGLADVLTGRADLARAVHRLDIQGARVDFIPVGSLAGDPADAIGRGLRAVVDQARARCDVVLIDTPPFNLFADAALIARHADGVLLVTRAGHTHQGALGFAAQQLEQMRIPVLGALLNDFDQRRDAQGEGRYDYFDAQRYHYAGTSTDK